MRRDSAVLKLAHNLPTLGGKPGSSSIPSVTRNPPDLGLLEVRRALQRPSMGFEPHGAHGSQAARVGSRPVGRVVLGCTCGGGAAPRGPPFPCASAGAAAGSDPRSYPRTFGRAERLWRRVRRCGQVDVLGHRGPLGAEVFGDRPGRGATQVQGGRGRLPQAGQVRSRR
jgi:hypothetical protein